MHILFMNLNFIITFFLRNTLCGYSKNGEKKASPFCVELV
ncbi:hypothetical protein FTV88_3318 [Heliorestis convoluta]|uniref:Uncharacterized protein n=1 Tax=Heliorestis convoluta TaxID=356322 RepID=A0A5Q2N613_9FIRM|nr:hypothetical protein FTV88_3318 [Heliorestis convoluta]